MAARLAGNDDGQDVGNDDGQLGLASAFTSASVKTAPLFGTWQDVNSRYFDRT